MTEENLDEETVIVTRRDRRRAEARADAEAQVEDNEATVVVGRSRVPAADVDEATIVVDRTRTRAEEIDEATVVVDRSRPAAFEMDESTVVVDRSGGAPVAPSGLEETIVRPKRGLRRRRNTVFDDVPSFEDVSSLDDTVPRSAVSFERPTEPEPPAIYKPRPAPLVPKAPPTVGGGPVPTRVENPALPSVTRQAVRRSRAALLAFVGACAVSVAGLVALIVVVVN